MNKFVYLATLIFLFGINVFSMEVDISWNERIYKHGVYGFSVSDYKSVSKIDYGRNVVIIAKWDEYIDFDKIIFKLYYNDNLCIFQKTIFGWSRYGRNNVRVECEITAEKEYLLQMKANDKLYYKCSFEFPSGEIFESDTIEATFSCFISVIQPDLENASKINSSLLLKSEDDEYYQILNYHTDGFFDLENPWYYSSVGNISRCLKFENLLPGKKYMLRVVDSSILFDGLYFYEVPYF
jgi:hypothetical protein